MNKDNQLQINICNIDNKPLTEKCNQNVDDPLISTNIVNVEKLSSSSIKKCSTYKNPTPNNVTTQTSHNLYHPMLNEETFTRDQFTQTCLQDKVIYPTNTTFAATSDFDLQIKLKNCLNMVETLKKEYTSYCNFQLYQPNNEYDCKQQVKQASPRNSTNADYKMFTNTCNKNGIKKWLSNQKYYCPRNLNATEKRSKSGFMFLVKNNEQSHSQRVLISFDAEIKDLKVSNLKKVTIERHISQMLKNNLLRNDIPKERDLIELESEPSLMSQVSAVRVEKAYEFPHINNKVVPDIESKYEDSKTTNENVNDLDNNDGGSLKTEYLYLPDALKRNKMSSNVIEMSETVIKSANVITSQEVILASDCKTSEHLNSITVEGFKKQEKVPCLAKTEKYKLIQGEKNKRESKKAKGKKLSFHGMFRFLRLKSKS